MSVLLILSVFSENMLKDPQQSSVKISNVSKEYVKSLAPRGASSHVKNEELSQKISEDIGVPIRYLGTKYLQFSPGDSFVVATKAPHGFEYKKIEVKKRSSFNLVDFFLSQSKHA